MEGTRQQGVRPRSRRTGWQVLLLLLAVAAVVPLPAGGAAGVEIVYPPDKVAVRAPEIQVVGRAGGQQGPVAVTLENGAGRRSFSAAVDRDAFTLTLPLAPGRNVIAIASGGSRTVLRLQEGESPPAGFSPYFTHSRGLLTGNCDDCHLVVLNERPDYRHIEQKVSCTTRECHPGKVAAEFLHGPVEDGFCDGCHNPHGTVNRGFLIAPGAGLCYRCHETEKETFAQGTVHFPVRKGECLSCHDPHGSDFEFHLKRGNVRELCAACHGYDRLRHKYMHEPVESEDCVACHNPHASANRFLLFEPGNAICFTCHELRKEEFESKYVHEPVKKDCTLCHDPHGSELEYHLRTEMDDKGRYIVPDKPFQATCLRCHDAKRNPELNEALASAKVRHRPVDEGKCTACHTPHSTNYPKQLKAPASEVCFSCHKKLGEKIAASTYRHGPIRANECYQCHLVHGSNYRKLLRDKFSGKFYSGFKLDNFRLCFDCHNQRIVTDPKDQETNFRDGEVNLHYVHVHRRKKGRNCITCHDVHASDQENHIRTRIPYRRRFSISLEYTATATGGRCVVGCHKPRSYDRKRPVGKQR